MRPRLRSILCLFVGFVLGVFAMERITAAAQPALLNLVRVSLQVESEFRAGHEARTGSHARSLVHRWNTVEFSRSDGEDALSRHFNEAVRDPFMPLRVLLIDWVVHRGIERDKSVRGARIVEGFHRQRLSASLLQLGHAEWAADEASAAKQLLPSPNCCPQPTYEQVLRNESTDSYIAAERVVLRAFSPPPAPAPSRAPRTALPPAR